MAYQDNSIEAKAEHIFANNPSKDQVFMTATGRAFWSAQALASAGFTLAYTFTRKQLESEKGLKEADAKAKAKAAAEEAAKKKAEAEAKAKAEADAKAKADAEAKAAAAKMEAGSGSAKTDEKPGPASNESTDGKEGTPDESWNVPEIKDWLTEREVKFAHNAKEANLLEKVAEYLNENPENK